MDSRNFDDHIDEQIKRAQAEGAFDNLPGKGKPMRHLDSDPMHTTLQAQGFGTQWVERDHEIRQKIEIAEQAVRRTYEWVMQSWGGGSADHHFAQDEWHKARRIFRDRLDEINRLIRLYNIEVPPTIGQKFLLREQDELQRLGLTPEIE